MTGAELRARRKALRLSQVELARRAKMSRDAVQYWERKAVVDPRQVGPRRFFEVLEVQDYPTRPAYARAGWGLTPGNGDRAVVRAAAEGTSALGQGARKQPQAPFQFHCGALTRKGQPCRNAPELGRTRCKFHGGRSTGPRTPEGRASIAEAQRQRWAAWRAAQRPSSHRSTKSQLSRHELGLTT